MISMRHVMGCFALLMMLHLIGCQTSSGRDKNVLKPFAPSGATHQVIKGKRYALLVGIDQFNDTKIGALKYARQDAKAMAKALGTFDKVWLLDHKSTTTRASILKHLVSLKKHVRSKHDTIVVYFSTHGTLGRPPGKKLRRYLVTSDSELSIIPQTGLAVRDILRILDGLPSRKRALILASCHSGQGKSKLSDALVKALSQNKSVAKLEQVSEANFVLSAASFKEIAREEDALKHDVYTYFLLQGMYKGDRDNDGAITLSEAHDYAQVRTYQFTKGVQRPVAISTIIGRDPIVLRGQIKRRPKPVIYSYRASSRGIEVHLGGRKKGVLPGGIAVSPGKHQIKLIDSQSKEVLYEGDIALDAGARLELTQVIQKQSFFKFELGAHTTTPWSNTLREHFIPTTIGFGIHGQIHRWPWSWSWLGLSMRRGFAKSQNVVFGQTLSSSYRTWQIHAQGGARFDLSPSLDVMLGLDMGMQWSSRKLHARTFSDVESLRGWSASLIGGLSWYVLGPWSISCQLNAGGLRAVLDQNAGPFGIGSISLWTGVRF